MISCFMFKVYPHVSCLAVHFLSLAVFKPFFQLTCVPLIVHSACIEACVLPSLFGGSSVFICIAVFFSLFTSPVLPSCFTCVCCLLLYWFALDFLVLFGTLLNLDCCSWIASFLLRAVLPAFHMVYL